MQNIVSFRISEFESLWRFEFFTILQADQILRHAEDVTVYFKFIVYAPGGEVFFDIFIHLVNLF